MTPLSACWRLLAFLFVLPVILFPVLLFFVTRVRAYETGARCLLRLADHVVKHLVDYLVFRLLLAARRVVLAALWITSGKNGRNFITEQRQPALFLANELGAVSAHPIYLPCIKKWGGLGHSGAEVACRS
jgi:hypothetical protein